MTDYLNPHHIYPDDISRRIDIAPGFDSRGIKPMEYKSARIAVDDLPVGATVKESLTTGCDYCNGDYETQEYCPVCGEKNRRRKANEDA